MDFVAHNYGEMIAQLYHIYREEATTNTAFKKSNDYYTFGLNSFDEIKARVEKIIAERENAYTKRTGQKVQAKSPKSRELMLEVNADTTAEDIMNTFGEYFKQTLGTEILAVAVHKDEGYLVGKEPPHRSLTSGIQFELDQKSGKYYELKSDGKNYTRGAELDISEYEARFNYHAHIIFSNLRADGSSITSKGNNFKPFNKFYLQEFHQIWTKIYNDKLPNKQPLEKAEKLNDEPTSKFKEALEIIADKIIQGTKNKQKLSGELELSKTLKDYINENPIKRIKGFKHFFGRLDRVANNETLNKRDYATFLSQMRESGCAVLLQQILLQKLSQMSEQELKTQDDSISGKFSRMVQDLLGLKPVEIDKQEPQQKKDIKTEVAELKAENDKLKAEQEETKAELKTQTEQEIKNNEQKKPELNQNKQNSTKLTELFKANDKIVTDTKTVLNKKDLSIKELLQAFKKIKAQNIAIEQELRKLREQKLKNAFNRTEVAQISTKGNLDDKSYTKEQKKLENDENQSKLEEITKKYESREQEKKPSNQVLKRK